MEAPAMHPTLIRVQFRKALGKDPEALFEQFDPEPFAAASLGQVHRATTRKGEKVAVKIQYPAIREVIENDFKILKTLVAPAKAVGYISAPAVQELERGILEETDYLNEARNINLFRAGLKPLPYAKVPRVHPRLSTDKVLTMSFMEGLHLSEFLATKPSQTVRNRVGTRLIELFCHQVHGIRARHADPHPGNYLFSKNGDINLLDFGCVKHLSPSTITLTGLYAGRAWEQSKAKFDDMVRCTWGKTSSAATPRAQKIMKEVIKFITCVYPADPKEIIDFGNPELLESLTKLFNSAFRPKLLNPELFFFSRTEMGIYNVLHTLKAKVPTTQTLARVLQRLGKEY